MSEKEQENTLEKLVYDAQLSFLVPAEWKNRLEHYAKGRWIPPSVVYREAILSYLRMLDEKEKEKKEG